MGATESRTFDELHQLSDHIAQRLVSHAPSSKSESPDTARVEVHLRCQDRYYFAAALLACAKTSLGVVLSPGTESAARLVLVDGMNQEASAVPAGSGPTLGIKELEEELTRQGFAAQPAERQHALELAQHDWEVTFWTSGSTGEPRTWVKRPAQLILEAERWGQVWPLAPGERVLCSAPPQHIYGFVWGVLGPLLAGASVFRNPLRHGPSIVDALTASRASRLVSVPAQLAAVAQTWALSGVPWMPREIVSSGSRLHPELALELAAHGARVVEVLGSTETGGVAFRHVQEGGVFLPLDGVKIAQSPEGQLIVDSPFLPEHQRPWVTTEQVSLEGPGFRHHGRSDRVIKVGSNRVALGEVEERVLKIPGVVDAHAVALPTSRPLTRSVELGVVAIAPSQSPQSLRSEIRKRLPPELWPQRVRVVSELPTDERGKVQPARLTRLFESPARAGRLEFVWTREFVDERGRPSASGSLWVPRDAPCLTGHFPGRPVVPAAVLLADLVAAILTLWHGLGPLQELARVRFQAPLGPEADAEVQIVRDNDRVAFTIREGGKVAVVGTAIFASHSGPGAEGRQEKA